MSDTNPFSRKQPLTGGLPFDHLSLAEVAECERLLALDWAGRPLGWGGRKMLDRALRRRHPPLYDPPAPSAA